MKQRIEAFKTQIHSSELSEIREYLLSNWQEDAHILYAQLNDFQNAQPIISAFRDQGANQLIQIFDHADDESLLAFQRLAAGSDISVLVELFLVKNTKDLDAVNRHQLIQFLRQPDITSKLTHFFESLEDQQNTLMSLNFLLLLFNPARSELDKLFELRDFLAKYSFPIIEQAFWAVSLLDINELNPDLLSPASNVYILLLSDLIQHMSLSTQIECLKGLNQDSLSLIVRYCLKGLISEDMEQQQAATTLLFLFCTQSGVMNKESRNLILHCLGQQDSYLFESSECQKVAMEVLAEVNSLPEMAVDGVWLEKLLTSYRFVAESSPQCLKNLRDRFGMFFLLVYQENYSDLILCLKEYPALYEQIGDCFIRINQTIATAPEARQLLLVKQFKLIKFAVDLYLDTIFVQLEDKCEQHNQCTLGSADQALDVLYSYYVKFFPDLRADLLLRAIDYFYRKAIGNSLDIKAGQSVLLNWMQQDTISQPVREIELGRKKEVLLYDSAGQQIGFLSESNDAFDFVNYEPVPLINTGFVQIHDPVYDKSGQVMGFFNETGQLRRETLFRKHTSAYLLVIAPSKELEKSNKGLDLLVNQVLTEGSLSVVYTDTQADAQSPKRLWLEQIISKAVQNSKKELFSSVFTTLVTHHDNESLFFLLANINNRTNALHLFHEILNQEEKRILLFSGYYESDFQQFLKHHDAAFCLSNYLAQYYDKPWFAEGLLKFAYFAKKFKQYDLLSKALDLLVKESDNDPEIAARHDLVLESLIGSEATAQLILKEFLQDHAQKAVQYVLNPEINKVAQHFYKQHLITAIHKLNNTSHWEEKAQYRLMLHILKNQYDRLFINEKLDLSSKQAWKSNELGELGYFISRHLNKNRPFDHQFALGHKLLGELIFRAANTGQNSLFYVHKKFNLQVGKLSVTRSFLERLIDKFWVPKGFKEQCTDTTLRIEAWLNEQSPLHTQLKNHSVLADWRHLVNQTWKETHNGKLPLLCVYLLNYSGPKKPLLILLRDYFQQFQKEADYIHPITQLLQQFPQRAVCAVIFDALETAVLKNPQILDRSVLFDMAYYYAQKVSNKEVKSPQAELDLLVYFGQNKSYPLVQKGCMELVEICEETELRKRLIRGANEARVEEELSASMGHFYFGVFKILKRLWHYGFNGEHNTSKMVKFCDDMSLSPARKLADKTVKAMSLADQVSSEHLEFKEKRKQLIGLLAAIKQSPVHPLTSSQKSFAGHSIFHHELESSQDKRVLCSNRT